MDEAVMNLLQFVSPESLFTGGLVSGVMGSIAIATSHDQYDLAAAVTIFGSAATSLSGGALLGAIDTDMAYAATESYIQSLSKEELIQLSDELNGIQVISEDSKQLVLK